MSMTNKSSTSIGITSGIIAGVVLGTTVGVMVKSLSCKGSPVKKTVTAALDTAGEMFSNIARMMG